MTRIFWFLLVIASASTNFLVKHHVQGLEDQLNKARRDTASEQQKIHDLTADWTFLNRPELLTTLNAGYIHLEQPGQRQYIARIDDIPMRPAAPAPEQAPAALPQVLPAAAPIPASPAPVATKPPVVPAVAPVPPPIVPVALTTPARPQPAAPAASSSLDALFARVDGGR